MKGSTDPRYSEVATQHKTVEGALPMTKHTTSMMPGTTAKESFTLKGATIFGGANLLADFAMRNQRLEQVFADNLAVRKAPNATYSMAGSMTAFTIATALGCGRVFHLSRCEQDPLLKLKTGWTKLPDYTTFYRDLGRFDDAGSLESLRPVLGIIAGKNLAKTCILDVDSTVETVYGNQEGAEFGYNPTKRGRASYHPLLFFDGISRGLLNARLRPGNANTAVDYVSALHETIGLLPEGAIVEFIRMDAGFAGDEVYLEAEEHTAVGYVAKTRLFEGLGAHAACHPWRRVEYTDVIIEAKSFIHQANRWTKARRVVMVRYRPVDEERIGQGKLFDDCLWQTVAMVTNLDWAEEDVWHFYNQRCAQENYIKEMKSGFGMDQVPSASYLTNYAVMLLKAIAYNLVLALRKLAGTPRFARMTVERLRHELFLIPAVLARHARGCILKLSADYQWQMDYLSMRRRLEALG